MTACPVLFVAARRKYSLGGCAAHAMGAGESPLTAHRCHRFPPGFLPFARSMGASAGQRVGVGAISITAAGYGRGILFTRPESSVTTTRDSGRRSTRMDRTGAGNGSEVTPRLATATSVGPTGGPPTPTASPMSCSSAQSPRSATSTTCAGTVGAVTRSTWKPYPTCKTSDVGSRGNSPPTVHMDTLTMRQIPTSTLRGGAHAGPAGVRGCAGRDNQVTPQQLFDALGST